MVRTRDYPAGPGRPAPRQARRRVDRAVFIPLVKDEPVLDGKLAPKGAGRGMAALVPTGCGPSPSRRPAWPPGVAGFVLPGNKVDVLLTIDRTAERRDGGRHHHALLQNVEILAVDQRIDAPADNRVDPNQLRSVTLLVTPDQAAKLGLAQNKGSLQLSLRNIRDNQLAGPPLRR